MPHKLTSICRYGPIRAYCVSSPIGALDLTCCQRAVHGLTRGVKCTSAEDDPDFRPDLNVRTEIVNCEEEIYKSATQCVRWLNYYFNPSNQTNVPLPEICHLFEDESSEVDPSFTTRVWRTLVSSVPPGQTVTYGELGRQSGAGTQSARAVGNAMRTNPVILVVPCHRVLPSGGVVGRYSGGGPVVKNWLLEHEAKCYRRSA